MFLLKTRSQSCGMYIYSIPGCCSSKNIYNYRNRMKLLSWYHQGARLCLSHRQHVNASPLLRVINQIPTLTPTEKRRNGSIHQSLTLDENRSAELARILALPTLCQRWDKESYIWELIKVERSNNYNKFTKPRGWGIRELKT